jgi:hypothetical protein
MEVILKSLVEKGEVPVPTLSKVIKLEISCENIQRMASWMIDRETM